ncbi:acyl-CoA dehydrogenase family protein [Reyranella sp.]|uniref:acyl-CoA dehydrogenase family protein n=1 Tax=Reyranella sp. TaxID=1929291 RepID=UPI002731298F|nr:acyl-CoA dehydrogenase family protein [Reyranella sp.]MDP2376165.1 acyl-CoA dehydrogenase family protein [Reyranella sp.]
MDTRVQPAVTISAPERARALQPLLDEHGAEMDRRRELTPEVVEALVGQDMLRLLLPESLGGQELHLLEYCKTTEALAWADASVGWFINQSNVSSATSAAAMPSKAAAAVFGDQRDGLAWGARHSKSRAIRVEGGYRLSGTWSFASGGRHTRWLGAHSAVQNPDGTSHVRYGRPDDRSFVFLRNDATITDDWHVLGLRGTGSDTYTVEDLFVPDERAPARDALEERREAGPIYTIMSTLLYATGFCGVTLGVARRLFEAYVELARGKHSRASPNAMAVNNAVQREIGLMEARLSAARAFLHEAACQAYEAAAAGKLDVDLRLRLRLATTFGMNEATDVAIASYRAAGTTAILNSGPFERRFRDAMSCSQHLQAMMPHVEMVGRHIIGTDNVIQHI